jgi:simple sugar transport system substrate-binding protein
MKALTTTAASAVLAAGLASAAMAQDAIRIVVVTHGQASDPFWSVVKNGVDAGAKAMGVTVEYRAPDTFDMVQMAQLIDAAVASQPDGLVVSIPDADALGPSIKNAVAAGIPVVSINSGSDVYEELGVTTHVGQREYESGLAAGKRWAGEGVKQALCINQEVGNVALDLRCKGFADGLGGNVEVLAVGRDPTEISNAVQARFMAGLTTGQMDQITAGLGEIGGVLTLGPAAAEPVREALETSGVLGTVHFGTFALSPGVLEAIRDGKMDFTIDQQPYLQGYLPVVFLTQNAKYGVMPIGTIKTGPLFVTQKDAEQVIELSMKGIR